jgi:hypothetical protein
LLDAVTLVGMKRERTARVDVVNAITGLLRLGADGPQTPTEARALATIVQTLEKMETRRKRDADVMAGVDLVRDLRRVYDRELRERDPDATFQEVTAAVADWESATRQVGHDALSQRRLEELQLDAAAIRARGGPKNAAVEMVEHVIGIPARTTYDREARSSARARTRDEEPELEARVRSERLLASLVLALESLGFPPGHVRAEAQRIRRQLPGHRPRSP